MKRNKLPLAPIMERILFDSAIVLLISAFLVTGFYIWRLYVAGLILGNNLPMETVMKMRTPIEENHRHKRDLALLPPPEDSTQIAVWAAGIEHHIGYPVAVFLQQDTMIRVVRCPEPLKPFTLPLAHIYNPASPIKERIKDVDTVGTIIFREGVTMVDTSIAGVSAFARIGNRVGWGIVGRREDWMTQWALKLFQPLTPGTARYAMASTDIRAKGEGEGMNIRLFDDNRLIGASSHVDTSHAKYEMKVGHLRLEFYDWKAKWENLLLHPYVLYALLGLDLVLVVVLTIFHRAFRRFKLLIAESSNETL